MVRLNLVFMIMHMGWNIVEFDTKYLGEMAQL